MAGRGAETDEPLPAPDFVHLIEENKHPVQRQHIWHKMNIHQSFLEVVHLIHEGRARPRPARLLVALLPFTTRLSLFPIYDLCHFYIFS